MGQILKNTFSWSVSRDRSFHECPRQYYFNHYGFWGGWESDAPERTREIYVLKQLLSRPTWAGQVAHDCIKRSLENLARGVPVLDMEEILAITRNRMRQDFRASRERRYWSSPKSACGLFEHEYDVAVTDEEWRATADHVDHCLRNFYTSDVYRALCDLHPDDFLEIERFSTFDLDGVEVSIKLDCAIREPDRLVVWDWKTGRYESREAPFQMACYTYYAARRFGVPVHSVVTRRFELYGNVVREHTLGERELAELLTYIRGSIKDMQALLDDPERNLATEDAFRRAVAPDRCHRCNFLRVCKPPLPARLGRDDT